MNAPARDHDRGRAAGPVAAVVLHEAGRQVGVRIERQVVFADHHARRFAAGARVELHSHGGLAGAAGLGKVGGELLLVEVEDAGGLAVPGDIGAVDVGVLHQLDDRVPARLVEAVLQRIARGVAAGAVVAHQLLHAPVLLGGLGQRVEHQVARQLPDDLLGIGHRHQLEVPLRARREIDFDLRSLVAERLRPHAVVPGRQRREGVVARLVGVDGRGDGAACRLRRHGDPRHLPAVRLAHRSAQHGLRRISRRKK